MSFRSFLSASAVAALFGSMTIVPVAAQDCSGDYEYVEQDCSGSSPGWFGPRPIRVKVVVRRPKFLMAPLAPAAPVGFATPAAPAAAAPAFAAPAMAMPMFTMMAAPAMAAPTFIQQAAAAPAAAAPASASPGLTDDQLRRLAELLQAAASAAPAKPAAAAACAPAAASAGLFRNCSESTGEIQQLRRDVDDLIKVTNRLTAVVEKLVEERPAK